MALPLARAATVSTGLRVRLLLAAQSAAAPQHARPLIGPEYAHLLGLGLRRGLGLGLG